MPVDTEHPDFSNMLPQWQTCNDVYAGQSAVHKAQERYLARLQDQPEASYLAYVGRAVFYNATYRTISGLLGMLFRQPLLLEVPESIKPLLEDVTLSGVAIQAFVQTVAEEALKLGRIGVFCDYPVSSSAVTQADAAKLNHRPTLQLYVATSIVNWRTKNINNKTTLCLVVLKESREKEVDEFKREEVTQWRVLDLLDDKKYRVRLFEKMGNEIISQVGQDIFPTMNGQPMDYIPFVFMGTDDVTPEIDLPPLIDLVNMNVSHYKTTADLEHGAHFTGLPTPWITGFKQENNSEKLYIGSSSAWVFPAENTKVGYLEFSGDGLQSLEKRIEIKEKQMAVLGARMLEPMIKGVEAADTASIHRKGEESMLSMVAQTLSMGMEIALKWFVEWAGADVAKVKCQVNRDFYPAPLQPTMLTALVASWQQGAISDQTLFENLQQGEIIDEDTTLEEEQARIGEQAAKFAQQQADAAALEAGAVHQATGGASSSAGGP